MKRKKPYIRLTNSEFAMMQLLWEAGRPLNRAEIMEIALRDPENPLFAKNSFHVIINNLIGYQFIAAFINDGPGRKNARRFAPLLTRNEYAGLQIAKRRIPLGVVGMIYEARPNVTVDAAGLCFKSGNAVILRGGKEALRTNVKLCEILRSVVASSGLDENDVQIIQETSHEIANQFMQLTDYLDVLIPRGSARLIKAVVNNAKVPVIETGAGNCHLYVDKDAEFDMAEKIVVNAKCQRPSVCNAAEKLLIHEDVAEKFLPRVAQALEERHVELCGDERTCAILGSRCRPATVEDWDTEYNDYILTIGIVDSLDEAILHINQHSTHHY